MNKEDLQRRAGILNENYTLRASGVAAFCMGEDGLNWEMDGIPPPPSSVEREQARAGHIDIEIIGLKKRAGIIEYEMIDECPGPDGSLERAMDLIRHVASELGESGVKKMLHDAYSEIKAAVNQSNTMHMESDVKEIARLAGIINEFVPDQRFTGGDGGGDGGGQYGGVPLWQRLVDVAKSAQGTGRIDQHQIEQIWLASYILKGHDQ